MIWISIGSRNYGLTGLHCLYGGASGPYSVGVHVDENESQWAFGADCDFFEYGNIEEFGYGLPSVGCCFWDDNRSGFCSFCRLLNRWGSDTIGAKIFQLYLFYILKNIIL